MSQLQRIARIAMPILWIAVGWMPSHAALIDRGNGLIYETDLNITWLQNANLAATQTFGVTGIASNGTMNGDTADAWIAAMNAADYKGFSDWRLPIGNANQCAGENCMPFGTFGSELANLYYTELGNPAGGPLTNTGPFANVQSGFYWGDNGSTTAEGTVLLLARATRPT